MAQIRKASIEILGPVTVLFEKYRLFYIMAAAYKEAELFIKERLTNKDAEIFVCYNDEGVIVGFMQLYPLFSSTRMKKLWLLNDLYVDEHYRGNGYSIMLIEKAKELCRETGACGLILETSKGNNIGNSLYPKAGFHLDEDHNYYSWEI